MKDWRSVLNDDPTEWLLEDDNPSVRYYTLTDILNKGKNASDVRDAKAQIMETGVVPRILAKQKKGGYWEKPENFYEKEKAKYKGTVWTFIILAELGADNSDDRIKNTCEFVLDWSQDRKSGGFAYRGTKTNGGQPSGVIPCLTGNMLFALIRLGYLKDPRVKQGIFWLTTYQRFDDGIAKAPKGWPYDQFEMCWGKHTCHMGVVKAMKALGEIPVNKRTKAVKGTLGQGAEFMLKHHIYKRSHNLKRVSKPKWVRFGFPLMYQTDVLEILGILTRLGYKDERMEEAVKLVIKRQDEQGRWLLQDTFNGRFQVNIERKGKPSKWITLNALRTLKLYFN